MKIKIDWIKISSLEILPHQEFDWIEYKGRKIIDLTIENVNENSARRVLSKAISAFSNTGGGYLLLGINDKTYTVDDNGVNKMVKPSGTKSWLEDIIPTLVNPTLSGFNVIEKTSDNLQEITNPERAIYVIDIPDSPLAPHQAYDNKYYGRIGGKSKPLSHQFVIDILGRRKDPDIKPEFCLVQTDDSLYLYILLENKGSVMGNFVTGWARIPKCLIPEQFIKDENIEEIDNIKYFRLNMQNTIKDVTGQNSRTNEFYGINRHVPILRGVDFIIKQELNNESFKSFSYAVGKFKIIWELAVDNTPMKSGEILFSQVIKQSKQFNI